MQQVEQIYLAAVERDTADRATFLREACAGDEGLRREVESLLGYEGVTHSWLEPPSATFTAPTPNSPDLSALLTDHQIGPYTIVSLLGAGGMGEVYLAQQEQPLRRRVALKLIKLGMDSREVVARFETERQALALMTHPNIAKVFDAGRAADGRWYFVMEYVPGVSITEYCDQQRLTIRSRLELFITVCEALHHAHQKGIVHRDVKPSNILVSIQDGHPMPRVIDFGIAKALNQRLAAATVFTQFGLLIGTPEYMSPEQAATNALDIDTTSDVYSLGVVLYELLVGALPFDGARLRRAGYDEMRRIIREEEVVRPSKRLTGMDDQALEVAKRQQTDMRSLYRTLHGDLDWVALKAMEKDRTRRYPSASELAADIRRHLADEPVIARPPSASYRLRKLAKRRKGAVVSVVLLVGALTAGLSTTLFMSSRARAAQTQAQHEAYVAMIGAADLSIRSGDMEEARRRLHLAAPELRGWEWHYLTRQSDPASRVLTAGGDVRRVTATADGRIVAIVVPDSQNPSSDKNQDVDTRNWRALTWKDTGANPVRSTKPVVSDNTRSTPISLSPDGNLLMTNDEVIVREGVGISFRSAFQRIYDLTSGQSITELAIPRLSDLSGAFTSAGTRVAVVGAYEGAHWQLRVSDLSTKQSTIIKTTPNTPCLSMAFNSTGERLAFTVGTSIQLLDRSRVRALDATITGAPCYLTLSPDGSLLFVLDQIGQNRSTGRVVDADSGRLRGMSQADERWRIAVFSSDSQLIATGSEEGVVRVFPPPTVGPTAESALLFGHRGPVTTLAFSPDHERLVSGSLDGTVRVWAAPFQREYRVDGATGPLIALQPGIDANVLSAGGSHIRMWNSRTGNVSVTMDARQQITSFASTPDAGQAVSGLKDGDVVVWSVPTGRSIATMRTGKLVNAVAIDPFATFVAAGDDSSILVWSTPSRDLQVLTGHTARVTALAVTSDGQFIISGSEDSTVRVWNLKKGLVRTLTGHTGAISSVVISPDGQRILSASRDRTLRMWSLGTGSELAVLRGHSSDVTAAAFSRDGTRIVSGSSDRTVRVWDTTLAVPLLTFSNRNQLVSSVTFADDDQVVVAGSFGGPTRIWETTGGNR